MKLFFIPLFLCLLLQQASAQKEHVILCGGPALLKFEKLRISVDRHDRFWGNFVRASTIRIDEIRKVYGPHSKVTWIVYKPGYISRGREDGKPLTTWIQEQATKRSVKLIWINTGSQAISALNGRPSRSVATFDFFGHSNKHCFMLDYGNFVMGSSKAWIHENDLSRIKSSIFAPNAICQSYGCYTAESMSAYWRRATGVPLIGAIGKTDYVSISKGRLPYVTGRWSQ